MGLGKFWFQNWVKQDLWVKKKVGQKHLRFQKKFGLKQNCETIFLVQTNVQFFFDETKFLV